MLDDFQQVDREHYDQVIMSLKKKVVALAIRNGQKARRAEQKIKEDSDKARAEKNGLVYELELVKVQARDVHSKAARHESREDELEKLRKDCADLRVVVQGLLDVKGKFGAA